MRVCCSIDTYFSGLYEAFQGAGQAMSPCQNLVSGYSAVCKVDFSHGADTSREGAYTYIYIGILYNTMYILYFAKPHWHTDCKVSGKEMANYNKISEAFLRLL